jgi:hypothetical protein
MKGRRERRGGRREEGGRDGGYKIYDSLKSTGD